MIDVLLPMCGSPRKRTRSYGSRSSADASCGIPVRSLSARCHFRGVTLRRWARKTFYRAARESATSNRRKRERQPPSKEAAVEELTQEGLLGTETYRLRCQLSRRALSTSACALRSPSETPSP